MNVATRKTLYYYNYQLTAETPLKQWQLLPDNKIVHKAGSDLIPQIQLQSVPPAPTTSFPKSFKDLAGVHKDLRKFINEAKADSPNQTDGWIMKQAVKDLGQYCAVVRYDTVQLTMTASGPQRRTVRSEFRHYSKKQDAVEAAR